MAVQIHCVIGSWVRVNGNVLFVYSLSLEAVSVLLRKQQPCLGLACGKYAALE